MMTDLLSTTNTLQRKGHDIVLTIDATESFYSRQGEIAKILLNTNLIDSHLTYHNIHNSPNTYQRVVNRM